ncbi:hypothetical protein GJV85_00935 [Sulfurimonas aquatica]|uniref:MBL fold metallo-hydrolase n=1 Tax=Sulfurimonas aquatica TaxID=2672570 RepID=A0A975AY46_9BACT|nr:MBL fold metallo-hydrolase [Sulfurimonas aquatica]QSZ40741.1 hypothetical protein GJV85_00935 [Sulfurimonas aquatica]
METELIFLSHASILIRYKDEYFLTDPWYQSPAFGSWIPIPPMYVHPAYVASIKNKLSILISHAHDDHCDEKFLQIFDRDTAIYSNNFKSKSVMKRVKRNGFTNYNNIDEKGLQIGSFYLRSFRNEEISLDDAMYTIRTPDALIIHCNDNWRILAENIVNMMREEVSIVGSNNTFYMSQNNAASGFPTVYTNITDKIRSEIQNDVINMRLIEGMKNANIVGARYFLPYAGYVGIFLKNKPELLENIISPSKKYIESNLHDKIPKHLEIINMMPGDRFNFDKVIKNFFEKISQENIKDAAINYYNAYGIVDQCQTYKIYEYTNNIQNTLNNFAILFNKFVVDKVSQGKFYPSIIGKTLSIIIEDINLNITIKFGEGCIEFHREANLVIKTDKNIMSGVLSKKIIFENLHVGLLAEFERHPSTVHHRDILMYITMFSYYYLTK